MLFLSPRQRGAEDVRSSKPTEGMQGLTHGDSSLIEQTTSIIGTYTHR
jgi:hypothetical protein